MKLRPRRARFSSRRYINLVAKHHLVDRLQAQSRAFVRGLAEVRARGAGGGAGSLVTLA